MAVTTIPYVLADYVGGLSVSPLLVVTLVLVVYLFLGCIMDAIAMILLTIPVFFPLVIGLGFDPVWFGVILVAMTEIGAITPPVGLNVYAIAGIAPDIPMSTIFKHVVPFVLADFARVAIYVLIPAVVLFLPNLIMG